MTAAVRAAETDTQIVNVDFTAGVVTIHNFGTTAQSLDFWRFCTHDENQVFQYSLFAGLIGQSIPAGGDMFLHYNNDAPALPNHFNISSLGPFATPLDPDGAYAMGLYWPNGGSVTFADPADLADHLQWSTSGISDPTADARSQVAVDAGLWTAVADWISTTPDSVNIALDDQSAGLLHGPDDYTVSSGMNVPVPRSVQITEVNFENGVITLANLGDVDVPLDGFTFCTHDENEAFRYSFGAALNGLVIEVGTTFHVHYNGDAPMGDEDHVNILDIGSMVSFALPLDTAGAYAIALYYPPVNFNNGGTMADYVQWSIDGVDNETADERADEAVTGGVWVSETDWVAVTEDTLRIALNDLSNAQLHASPDYDAVDRCLGDCTPKNDDNTVGNQSVNIDDILAVVNAIASGDLCCDTAPPQAGNNEVNIDDLLVVINNFGACNPPSDG
jgi:hypothetical protein